MGHRPRSCPPGVRRPGVPADRWHGVRGRALAVRAAAGSPARLLLSTLAVLAALTGVTVPVAYAAAQPRAGTGTRPGSQVLAAAEASVLPPLRPLSGPALATAGSLDARTSSARTAAALPDNVVVPIPQVYDWQRRQARPAAAAQPPAGLHPGRAPPLTTGS